MGTPWARTRRSVLAEREVRSRASPPLALHPHSVSAKTPPWRRFQSIINSRGVGQPRCQAAHVVVEHRFAAVVIHANTHSHIYQRQVRSRATATNVLRPWEDHGHKLAGVKRVCAPTVMRAQGRPDEATGPLILARSVQTNVRAPKTRRPAAPAQRRTTMMCDVGAAPRSRALPTTPPKRTGRRAHLRRARVHV